MIRIDMDMPENCGECRFLCHEDNLCLCAAASDEWETAYNLDIRPEWCPLRPIVTCGECEHFTRTEDSSPGWGWCMGDDATPSNRSVKEDWFCGDGEKRE